MRLLSDVARTSLSIVRFDLFDGFILGFDVVIEISPGLTVIPSTACNAAKNDENIPINNADIAENSTSL